MNVPLGQVRRPCRAVTWRDALRNVNCGMLAKFHADGECSEKACVEELRHHFEQVFPLLQEKSQQIKALQAAA